MHIDSSSFYRGMNRWQSNYRGKQFEGKMNLYHLLKHFWGGAREGVDAHPISHFQQVYHGQSDLGEGMVDALKLLSHSERMKGVASTDIIHDYGGLPDSINAALDF